MRSLAHIATRSMPTPSCLPVSIASLSLVPTPSLAATSSGSSIARRLQVEKAAESAQLGIGAGPRGRFGQRRDGLYQRIAGGDRNAGVGIGQRLLRSWPAAPSHILLGFPRHCRQKRADAVFAGPPSSLPPPCSPSPDLGGALVAQMESGERGILPIDSSGTLEISGIQVDVGGKDADQRALRRLADRPARGLQGAVGEDEQAAGHPRRRTCRIRPSTVWSARSSSSASRSAPTAISPTLGVLFDRHACRRTARASPGEVRRSAPMLLIPVMVSGGTATSVELRNPWQRAWAQFRTSQSAIDYVRVSGLGVDPLLVNAAQTRRPGRGWWRNVLDLYGAANILVAEVQARPALSGRAEPRRCSSAGSGPTAGLLGSFELTARDSDDLPRMMSEGVQRMDEMFTQALAAGIVRGDPDLIIQPPPPPEEGERSCAQRTGHPADRRASAGDRARRCRRSRRKSVAQIRGLAGVDLGHRRRPCRAEAPTCRSISAATCTALGRQSRSRGWAVTNRGGDPAMCPRGAAPGVNPDAMKSPADQIALPLDWPQAEDDSRFILSEANRDGVRAFPQLEPVAGQGDHADRAAPFGPVAARARPSSPGSAGACSTAPNGMTRRSCSTPGTRRRTSGRPLVMIVDEVPPAWEVGIA